MSSGQFEVRFWGVRGSYPTSDNDTSRYGGHTSCVQVQVGGHCLIFDAGTGIIDLGKELFQRRRPLQIYIFLSHTHHDHLFGLYFFEPLLKASTRLFVFGPDARRKSLRTTLHSAMGSPLFPVSFQELDARKEIYSLKGGEIIRLRPDSHGPKVERLYSSDAEANDEVMTLTYKSPAHPKDGVMLYRVGYRGKSLVYATDIEEKKGGYPEVIEFVSGADLLIHDAQYLSSEYFSRTNSRKGWGHSTPERAVEVARKAGVKQLVLFHHEPAHDDKTIREIERQARHLFSSTVAAYEGMTVDLM